MCYVCCKELKGWCKSFTRTEGLLSLVEAVLLVVLISFLVFLILHFTVCRTPPEIVTDRVVHAPSTPSTEQLSSAFKIAEPAFSTTTTTSTLSPDIECTWDSYNPTTSRTRYYLTDKRDPPAATATTPTYIKEQTAVRFTQEILKHNVELEYDEFESLEEPDGDVAEDGYKRLVVALVKLKPSGDVTFGCILTKITKYWTLTAASCIESIEEVDPLDAFMIIEEFGEKSASRPRGVADVRVHPRYQGRARHHDLAALRSDRALRSAALLRLPHLLDYFLLAVGERLHILGYGGHRTVTTEAKTRRLRRISVFSVGRAACGADGWAARHLARGAVRHGACGAGPQCAAVLRARALPCYYCAGTPLLRAGTLLGVMSDAGACGLACDPQLYVNIATVRDWIESVIN